MIKQLKFIFAKLSLHAVNQTCAWYHRLTALTTRERALIQTFPETFDFSGPKTEIEQIIGNAVPVKLAEYVAKTLSKYLRDKIIG